MLLCNFGLYSKSLISLNSCSSDLGITALTLAMFRQTSFAFSGFSDFTYAFIEKRI